MFPYACKAVPHFSMPESELMENIDSHGSFMEFVINACVNDPAFTITTPESMDTLYVMFLHDEVLDEAGKVIHQAQWLMIRNYNLPSKPVEFDTSELPTEISYAHGPDDIYFYAAKTFIEDEAWWEKYKDYPEHFFSVFYPG